MVHITKKSSAVLDDRSLLKAAQKHHDEFGILYMKYKNKVLNYFLYRVNREIEIAEDLTQETFIRAFRSLDNFKCQDNVCYLTYLITIAHNLLVNYYRSKKTVSLENMLQLPQGAIIETKREYENKIDMNVIWNYAQHLSPLEQDILKMKYQEDLQIVTIAKRLDKSSNAVKIILSRARKKLKKKCHSVSLAPLSS